MKKKIIAITLIIGLFDIILFSCCPDPMTFNFNFIEIGATNRTIKSKEIINDKQSVNYKDYNIVVSFKNQKISNINFSDFILNKAYALTCDDDKELLKDKINTIKISSDTEIYDTPAETTINEKNFEVFKFDLGDAFDNRTYTLSEFVQEINNSSSIDSFSRMNIKLNNALTTEKPIKFNIEIALTSGKILKAETTTVKFE